MLEERIMKGVYLFICFNIFLALFLVEVSATESKNDGVYIVYMGASRFPDGAPRNDHAQLVSSLMKRNKNSVLHTYSNGFSGFAARLSEEEAKKIAKTAGVVSFFPDPIFKLHTTRSWDFLKLLQSSPKIESSDPRSIPGSSFNGAGSTIGILDTGIWPESESFKDEDMAPVPSSWKGICMDGKNFSSSNCNRKLVGARYYDPLDSPIDDVGHGTHVASTAAGKLVPGASYYGLAKGTAKGGSPGSRIAIYRVCGTHGCYGSAILKGFDDSIGDGVDVISISLGPRDREPDFVENPIAIGAFHAAERGIVVVCSAGNDGPAPRTVANFAPWILTVAATTSDRDFEADIVLKGHKVIKGFGINFSDLKKSPVYPLTDGKSAKSKDKQVFEDDASNCIPGSLDGEKVKGKIIVCETNYGYNGPIDTLNSLSAIGLILIDTSQRQDPPNFETLPISVITSDEDAAEVLSYIYSNSEPMATILPTVTPINYKPAPVAGFFSSRGPALRVENLLKPDIAAPGLAILAACPPNAPIFVTLPGREPPVYGILSGTSMSCPHVSGLAASVKSRHPTWSNSAIKSAIMTTAIQRDNLNGPITTEKGSIATAYDIGAGEINLSGPFEPGLVYETETSDYIQFLCNYGYDTTKVKTIASNLPKNFSCPVNSNYDSISNMNYPSIAVSNLMKNGIKTVYRTVTNVGEDESIYTAVIEAPNGVEVEVLPNELQFTKGVKKMKFEVSFKATEGFEEHLFGSITWSNEKYNVRSPFVVIGASS